MKPTAKTKKEGIISIKTKIFAGLVAVILLALALLWLCQVVLFDVVYSNVRINEIKSTARHATLFLNSHSFYSQLESACTKTDICATVLSSDGSISYSVETGNACLIHDFTHAKRQELISLIAANTETVFGITYDAADDSYTVTELSAIPFPEGTNVIYVASITHNGENLYLLLDGVISPVGTVTKTSASFLVMLSLLLFSVALLMAHAISKVIANPIAKINEQAKTLSSGGYTAVESNTLEIAELNETLIQTSKDLQQVEHLRHELIANISHDLRTPLTLMSGYLEMMKDFPDEITEENLDTVINESRRLTSLVNDMLDISRLENGMITPKPQIFSLTDKLEESIKNYQEFSRKNGYTFQFVKTENISVNADPTLIMQVFNNLLNNAMTYTGDDLKITVTQILREGNVRVEVSDTGDGIDPEKLPLIWDRYYTIDSAHKRAVKGTGLGLSIVRSVITLHGGSYGARSQPGKGSTFWFELSCLSADPTEESCE